MNSKANKCLDKRYIALKTKFSGYEFVRLFDRLKIKWIFNFCYLNLLKEELQQLAVPGDQH